MKKYFLPLVIIFVLSISFIYFFILQNGREDGPVVEITFETIEKDDFGGHIDIMEENDVSTLLITKIDDWISTWEYVSFGNVSKIPEVDFSESAVLAILHGESLSCGSFSVKKIYRAGNKIEVLAERSLPGENCYELGMVAECIFAPYHIVKIPRYPNIDRSNVDLSVKDIYSDCYEM